MKLPFVARISLDRELPQDVSSDSLEELFAYLVELDKRWGLAAVRIEKVETVEKARARELQPA